MWMRQCEELPSKWHGVAQYDWNRDMFEVMPFPLFWLKRVVLRLRAYLVYNYNPSKFERDLANARQCGYNSGVLNERHRQELADKDYQEVLDLAVAEIARLMTIIGDLGLECDALRFRVSQLAHVIAYHYYDAYTDG